MVILGKQGRNSLVLVLTADGNLYTVHIKYGVHFVGKTKCDGRLAMYKETSETFLLLLGKLSGELCETYRMELVEHCANHGSTHKITIIGSFNPLWDSRL